MRYRQKKIVFLLIWSQTITIMAAFASLSCVELQGNRLTGDNSELDGSTPRVSELAAGNDNITKAGERQDKKISISIDDPPVPAALSSDPNDPDWVFEGYAKVLSEEEKEERRKRNDYMLTLSDEDYLTYKKFIKEELKNKRREEALRNGKVFDERDDLLVAILPNNQVWRKKMSVHTNHPDESKRPHKGIEIVEGIPPKEQLQWKEEEEIHDLSDNEVLGVLIDSSSEEENCPFSSCPPGDSKTESDLSDDTEHFLSRDISDNPKSHALKTLDVYAKNVISEGGVPTDGMFSGTRMMKEGLGIKDNDWSDTNNTQFSGLDGINGYESRIVPTSNELDGLAVRSVFGNDSRLLKSKFLGHSLTSYPWRTHGLFTFEDEDTNNDPPISLTCSGTKIGPRLVVTSGHCIYDGGWLNGSKKWVPGGDGIDKWWSDGDMSPNGWYGYHARAVHTDWYDHGSYNDDIGLYILGDNQSSCNLGWLGYDYQNGISGDTVNVYGFPGAYLFCEESPYYDDHYCYGSLYGDSGQITWAGTSTFHYSIDTDNGQSGSGVYKYYTGSDERYVIGVHKGTWSTSTWTNYAVKINNGKFDWIDSVEDNNPSSYCSR